MFTSAELQVFNGYKRKGGVHFSSQISTYRYYYMLHQQPITSSCWARVSSQLRACKQGPHASPVRVGNQQDNVVST